MNVALFEGDGAPVDGLRELFAVAVVGGVDRRLDGIAVEVRDEQSGAGCAAGLSQREAGAQERV